MKPDRQKIEQDRQLRAAQLKEDYRRTFIEFAPGKRVLRDLLRLTHTWSDCFTGNSRGMKLEGERAVGLHLLRMLDLADLEGLEALKTMREDATSDI